MKEATLHPTPENPLPPGAEGVELLTRDKRRLRAMRAVPENARGTFVILGGRGDFIERYFETARDLIARGFAVVALDMRGQGGSQPATTMLDQALDVKAVHPAQALEEQATFLRNAGITVECGLEVDQNFHGWGGHALRASG